MKKIYTVVLFLLFVYQLADAQSKIQYPNPKKVDQSDNYFGTVVEDPYRWMEDLNSQELKQWIQQENSITENYLKTIPYRENIKNRLTELWNFPKTGVPFKAGDYYFFFKNTGLQNQSILYRTNDLNSEPEIFLDPNTFSADGTVALSNISPSHNGKYLAYSISKAGSDWQEFYVMEIESKKLLSDKLDLVKFSGENWFGEGFFYGKYDEPKKGDELKSSNQFQKVYYHRIGTSQADDKLYYQDTANATKSFELYTTKDEDFLFLSVSVQGHEGNLLYYKKLSDTTGFIQINKDIDVSYQTIDNVNNDLYLSTNDNASNGKIVKINTAAPVITKVDVFPATENPLKDASIYGNKFILQYTKDVTDRIFVYDLNLNFEKEITLPAQGTVSGVSGKKDVDEMFYAFTSFTYPAEIYRYDIKTGTQSVFIKTEVAFNPEDYITEQVFYKSKDGTSVPMFLVHKKNIQLDGNNPALLYAYGGFNASMMPSFSPSRLLFLESGGIYALANIRGGSEYGEEWHKAGMKFNKQNVFDDFISAAEYLIDKKYTSSSKLAIMGGSNGGLLVGAVVNQRPDLFKVAFPAVGVMDMLRFQKFTIGWAWVTEYGSSDDKKDFANLIKYSPYHNIKAGLNYPSIFVTTSDHDDRVVPSHSFKYTARIQELYKGDNPVLMRVETDAGHGSGKPTAKAIEETADIYSFLFYQLGMKFGN